MFVRIYSEPDGESHFEEFDLPFEPADLAQQGSFITKTSEVSFNRQMSGQAKDYWHPANHRTYVVFLTGMIEIEVGSGEVRRFGPADVLLEEDITGRGHRGRVVGNEPLIALAIKLAD